MSLLWLWLAVGIRFFRELGEVSTSASDRSPSDEVGSVPLRHGQQLPAAADTVTITVHSVTLRPDAELPEPKAGERPRLFVEYRFLDVPAEQLETPVSLPLGEPSQPLHFNFRKVITVGGLEHRERRRLLARQLRRGADHGGLVTFTVVAEPPDSVDESAECTDVGYAHLSLPELLTSGVT
ncbi:X-linked retinitis pigmentosa GTPase regulator-interacting protein 1-like [Pollicipes pollicipes]|uniref:X-linked retinitis pigmentosa GTPase regulator-interacting protein 1-like n=1 Tax=Pollicipes pollicipes TaxID=41117 RepID=UPI001884C968|nr:X-linked retinitis pigmentosa GTPase regulator-interacting protein 1-like [Pollicipes pollicipes]